MNEQLIEKAKAAKSAEELMAIAKENGIELTEKEAAEYFAQLNKSGELADEELDSVAGGGCVATGLSKIDANNELKPGDRITITDGYENKRCNAPGCNNVIFVVDRVRPYGVDYHCEKCGCEGLNTTDISLYSIHKVLL